LAVSVVLIAGSLAVSPIAIADEDDDDDDDEQNIFGIIIQKLDEILAAIEAGLSSETETQIDNIESEVTNIEGKLDGTVSSLVTDIKTETDKIQMVKDDVGMIKTTVGGIDTSGLATQSSVDDIQTDLLSTKSFYQVEDIVTFVDGPDRNFDVLVSLSCPGSVPAEKQAFNIETMGIQVSQNPGDQVAFFNSTVIDQSFGYFYAEAVSTFIGSNLVYLDFSGDRGDSATTIGASEEVRFRGNVVNIDAGEEITLKAVAIGEKPLGCDVTIDANVPHLGLPLPFP